MRISMRWAALALVLFLLAGCGGAGKAPAFAESGGLKVATSFYPLYEFARVVGGEKIDLINLVPPGTEPHDWEPTAGHIKALNSAQVFLYNGAGMEHWVEKTVKSLQNSSLAVVEASRGFALLEGAPEDEHGHAGEKDEHGHGAEEFDPHIWLDPRGAIHMVEQIRDAFVQADAANKALYEANAAAQIAKLKALDAEFAQGLAQCSSREFFTSHAAFGYLAHRYGLEQHAIMGLAPDAEPTPKELQEIVAEAREHNVKYIFFETLVSDKVAKVVAQEIGAQTLVLNPFEGLTDEEIKAGKDYLAVMRENLTNLKTALDCK
ncbi:MAG: metal ABC transporter substrate-binding protein [Bacillota bacterium]